MSDNGRREFLRLAVKGLGLAAMGPVLYKAVLEQLFQQAYAQTVGETKPYNYVHMSFPGGPPRWFFDLLLLTEAKKASNFVDGGFGTLFEGSASTPYKAVYSANKTTVNGNDLYLPPVWNMGYANQNFADLLPNTLFVRGMDMEINSHVLSSQRQVAPIIGGASLNGVAADGSSLAVPALADPGVNAALAFRSNNRLSMTRIDYTSNAKNAVATVLKPFEDFRAGRKAHTETKERLSEQALVEFEKMAMRRGLQKSALPAMYANAMKMINENVLSLGSDWDATLARYQALVKSGMQPAKGSLSGLFDKTIKTDGASTYDYSQLNDKVNLGDLRDMVTANTTAPRMAENFALTEIMLGKVSSSFLLGFPSPTGFQAAAGKTFNMTHDQHNIGNMVSTMNTTLFYRSFLGCLTEFTAALKRKMLFDKTVIHISSEFNRTPRENGSGADHGFMAGNTTLISGMIDGGEVVGNISKQGLSNTYKGTFGIGTNYELGGLNRPIQVNDVALTITSMIGAPSIVTNGRSLLLPNGTDKWRVAKKEAKNV